MRVPPGIDDSPLVFLSTDRCSCNPRVVQNFSHRGSFPRLNFQHPSNDVSALTWKEAHKPPWTLDDLRFSIPIFCCGPTLCSRFSMHCSFAIRTVCASRRAVRNWCRARYNVPCRSVEVVCRPGMSMLLREPPHICAR